MFTSQKTTTPEGLARLEGRLAELEQRLAELLASKAEAAEVGGNVWHDNASFEELERNERVLRRRIADLNSQLQRVIVVDGVPENTDAVSIGTKVTIRFDGETEPMEVHIKGHGESDAGAGVITCDAPLAQALMGAQPGDTVEFQAGRRSHRVTVEAIR